MEGTMNKVMLASLTLLYSGCLTGCAHTYNMPEAERSRSYQADPGMVWEAALASVDDIGLALVETEQEHGRIRARAGASIWDLKGHILLIVVRELGDGLIRVDANAETVSADSEIDFGRSGRIVRNYLRALDARLGSRVG
jgi:hypothetical protein